MCLKSILYTRNLDELMLQPIWVVHSVFMQKWLTCTQILIRYNHSLSISSSIQYHLFRAFFIYIVFPALKSKSVIACILNKTGLMPSDIYGKRCFTASVLMLC